MTSEMGGDSARIDMKEDVRIRSWKETEISEVLGGISYEPTFDKTNYSLLYVDLFSTLSGLLPLAVI